MTARHVLTILAVDDVPANVEFFRAAFGWSVSVDTAVYVEFELATDRRIGIYQREAFARNTGRVPVSPPPGEIGATELYFVVDDLEAASERLGRAGAILLSGPTARPWGDRAAYFADPSGNVIVVAQTSG